MKLFDKWPHKRLGDICSKIGSGATPRGGDSVYQTEGPAIIRSQNVYNGIFNSEGLARLRDDHAEQLEGVTIESGDVLLNITGDSVARCCQAPEWIIPARVNQHVAIIRPDGNKLNPRFLCYYLISPLMQTYLLSIAGSGGTRKALTKGMIEDFQVPCPKPQIQEQIVNIIGAYDDLIENNRRRMKLLEDSARLLYEEWFVRLRFPGHEHTPIVHGVPEGWEKKLLSELCESIDYGYTESAVQEKIGPKFLRITDIVPDFIDWSTVPYCPIKEEKLERFRLIEGDIVIARTGATVGYAKRLHKRHPEAVFASYLVRFRLKPAVDNLMVGVFVESDAYKGYVQSRIGGAAQPNANAKVLSAAKILIPNSSLQRDFHEFVEPLVDQREILLLQNQQLCTARDLLLPRLMSGEITV
jgi:type I restriction enzyme, S subunit